MEYGTWGKRQYTAFTNAVNMELFHAMQHMIMRAADPDKRHFENLRLKCGLPFYWDEDYAGYFGQYQLAYPGEVLERFEEKIGDELMNLRALALALGNCANILDDTMFIGDQKDVFIGRIRAGANKDIFLSGAIYMLADKEDPRKESLGELSRRQNVRIEEALFLLALYEDKAQGFQQMRPLLVKLWGEQRNFNLFENAGLLKWLIDYYEEEIMACRKRDNMMLRTLVKLAYKCIQPCSKEFETLEKAGYNEEEIAFCNSVLMWLLPRKNRIVEKGIVGEKISARCCITMINGKRKLGEDLYQYLFFLLEKYKKYEICYESHPGIWHAIECHLQPVQPEMVLWLFQKAEKDKMYQVDVFDHKWDILARELNMERYFDLFAHQIASLDCPNEEQIRKYLKCYEALTQHSFMDYFKKYRSEGHRLFQMFVENGVILLNEYQEGLVGTEKTYERDYLWNYVSEIPNRKVFDFWRQYLEKNDMMEIPEFFGASCFFHTRLGKCLWGYSHTMQLNYHRDFLKTDERKRLLEWMDESIFRFEPEHYIAFVNSIVSDENFQKLYEEEMPELIMQLDQEENIPLSNLNGLKKKLYDTDMLEKEEEEQKKRAAEREERDYQKDLELYRGKLKETFDGSIKTLENYVTSYYRYRPDIVISLVHEELQKIFSIENSKWTKKEISMILEMYSKMLRTEGADWRKMKEQLYKLEGKEC